MTDNDKVGRALADIEQLKQQLAELKEKEAKAKTVDNDTGAAEEHNRTAKRGKDEATAVTDQPLSEQQQLENLIEELKQELSDHQGASILGAFALGFLLGRLLR